MHTRSNTKPPTKVFNNVYTDNILCSKKEKLTLFFLGGEEDTDFRYRSQMQAESDGL